MHVLRYLIFICTISIVANQAFGKLSYEIHHFPKDNKLTIKLEFTSSNLDSTELYIPSKIWGHDVSKQIKNIKVQNGIFIQNNSKITPRPNQKITVSYDIYNTEANLGSSYYTYITEQGFYFLYNFALIYPKIYKTNEIVDIDFKFASNNNVFTNSGNINTNKVQNLNLAIDDLISEGFAISGNSSVLQHKNYKDSNIVFFDIDTKLYKSLSTVLYKIQECQERFFAIKNKNNLFVFINNNRDHNSYYGSLIGSNTVLYFLPKKFDLSNYNVKHLLGHENLHKWIGNKLINENDDHLYKWFIEGFTKYFTDKINLNNGVVTSEEYLNNYNKILQQYYTSPYLLFDNDKISKLYWKDSAATALPYNRGYIIAQELDMKIQKTTNGKFSLNDIIKTIINNSILNRQYKFSTAIMAEYINNLTKSDYKYIVKRFVKHGKFELSDSLLNISKLYYKEIKVNDYDFDITHSQKIVTNLKTNTEAYKAGLRNNDKFVSMSTSQQNEESSARVTIELGNGKSISYDATRKLVKIPQYVWSEIVD